MALACVLITCLCLPAPRAEALDLVYGSTLQTQVAKVDLNKAWLDTSGAYTITKSGTYSLSGDLSVGERLIVNAPDQDVTIKPNGHKLTIDGGGASEQQTMLSIVAAKSVTIDGAAKKGRSIITSAGKGDIWAVSSTASDCAVNMNDVEIDLAVDSNALRFLHNHCVRISSGSLDMTGCTVSMDMGNQTYRAQGVSCIEAPSAVYATSDVSSVNLTDCTVKAVGTSAFSLSDLADMSSVGNVYALYSLAKKAVVKGGSFTVESVRGNATCLYGAPLEVASGGTSALAFEANAGQLATGILSTSSGGATIGAPFTFGTSDLYSGAAQAEAALRSSVPMSPGGFVFGNCGSGSGAYPALVMTEGGLMAANASLYCLGAFEASLSSASRASVLASLGNALGKDASCALGSSGSDIAFELVASRAAAEISETGTRYSTVEEAAAALAPGQTLRLLKNAGAVSISTVGNAVLDLNGFSAESLEFSYADADAGLTVRNGAISGTKTVGTRAMAVYHRSASPLTLSGVAVPVQGLDVNLYGVYATGSAGDIALCDGATVSVVLTRASLTGCVAYGVYAAEGSSKLSIGDGSSGVTISASTVSPGVDVFGVYGPNGIEVSKASVAAQGVTGATRSLYVGGEALVSGSTLEAHTTGVASSAAGVQLGSYPAVTGLTLDACTVAVSASPFDDVSTANYACVLGATTASDTSLASAPVTLSGASSYSSASGMHFGLNLGKISLGSGFTLSGGDDVLYVSQVQRDGDVGFTASSGSLASSCAGFFAAREGSHYVGCKPVASGNDLVWRPEDYDSFAGGIVRVAHGSSSQVYSSLGAALAAASDGDTVSLLGDLSEQGLQAVDERNLTIDLAGHELTLRAGGLAVAGDDGTGGALAYTGTGTLTFKDGSSSGALDIQVGAAMESSAGATYQGIAVSGGGTLKVASGTTVRVSYTGSTSSNASQSANTALRGIAITNGSVDLDGVLEVSGASSEGAKGAMNTFGIFSQPASGAAGNIDIDSSSSVKVACTTAVMTTSNPFYPEYSAGQATAAGLREIHVDPTDDADFYNALVRQFRISASYDDPGDSSLRSSLGAYIYFVQPMTLDAEGAWYDGMRVWAFSDEVPADDAGTMEAITPTHFFISTQYDTLPNAYGVATGSNAAGTAKVSVDGSVTVDCTQGNAYALNALCSEEANVSWLCSGASLSASADPAVHLVARKAFDLRDYLDFTLSDQADVATYSTTRSSKAVEFASPISRDIVSNENVELTLAGVGTYKAMGADAVTVETASFTVSRDFALASGSDLCSVASSEGDNVRGAVFAKGATDASLFVDAYRLLEPGVTSGGVAWSSAPSRTVSFQVGDAVVARYADPTAIDLSEIASKAARYDDQRQSFSLVGWSLDPDENATSGYVEKDAVINPSESAVYYAVYGAAPIDVPVVFSNVYLAEGSDEATLQPRSTVRVPYGMSLGEAGVAVPEPSAYVDSATGLTCRFVGWWVEASSSACALLYGSDKVLELEPKLGVGGLGQDGFLTLRAVYVPVAASQHLVSFVVDGYTSAYAVDDGARPFYTGANNTYGSYASPAKQATENGKTFACEGWFVDANADSTLDSDEMAYSSMLPKVTEDAIYTANWSWTWSDTVLSFYYSYLDESTDTVVENALKTIPTTYETRTQDAADSVATIGSSFGYGGRVYTLEGWSPRSTDTEPVYDAARPLPSYNDGADSARASYATTYYGVYSTYDHVVTVTFKDGGKTLGKTTVSGLRSVDYAFVQTGVTKPTDKSSSEKFLGWATSAKVAVPVDGASSTLDSVGGSAASEITLYAVYGTGSASTVRLRNADGSKVLYKVSVAAGSTVNAAFEKAGKKLAVAAKKGYYFSGWRTASGERFDLDTPVSGSMNLYASYKKATVRSDTLDVSATFTSISSLVEAAESLRLEIVDLGGVQIALSDMMKKSSYVPIGQYSMRLIATDASGNERVVEGDVGTIALSVKLGAKYGKSTVRAFWMGLEGKNATIRFSDAKTVDADGKIAVNVGNYAIGDETEGGNLAVAYVEGGTSAGSLAGGSTGSLSPNTPGSLSSGSSKSLSSSLASGSLSANSLSGSLSSNGGLASNSANGAVGATDGNGLATADSDTGSAVDGAVAEAAQTYEEESEELDSSGIVLMILAGVAVLALLYGFWRLAVVRQRRNESEADLPAMADQYSKGIMF